MARALGSDKTGGKDTRELHIESGELSFQPCCNVTPQVLEETLSDGVFWDCRRKFPMKVSVINNVLISDQTKNGEGNSMLKRTAESFQQFSTSLDLWQC